MSKFNKDNKGHLQGYPLFLGEPLGVLDTINVQYPQLEDLYQEQLAQLWNEFEVDLTHDRLDMVNAPPGVVDLMVKTIMWQTVADSVASRSIVETMGEFITNGELMNLATIWSFFEVIHARTYSHIIKQTFIEPNDLLKEIYANSEVLSRSDVIVNAFDRLAAVDVKDTEAVRRALLLALIALFTLESIAFMASFATTFAIVEKGWFQGIGKLVGLICRDEVLHTRNASTVVKLVLEDPEWFSTLYSCKEEVKELLDCVVENEVKWANYAFSEGREVSGLNATILSDYVYHMAAPVYRLFGEEPLKEVPVNPIPYITKYIDTSKMQTANMELQNSSYLIGTIEDDTQDLDFGDMEG